MHQVTHLAARCTGYRLDALRPAPARFDAHPHRRHVTELDHLDLSFLDRARLLGTVKALPFHLCHRRSPPVILPRLGAPPSARATTDRFVGKPRLRTATSAGERSAGTVGAP